MRFLLERYPNPPLGKVEPNILHVWEIFFSIYFYPPFLKVNKSRYLAPPF